MPSYSQKTNSLYADKYEKINIKLYEADKTIKIQEERLIQSSETIANLNSLVTGFGTIYTVLTIIFALIGLLIPLFTYYLTIKPSQKLIKTLDTSFDERFNKYLKDSREREIDNAIENLSSTSSELRQNATTFLSLNQHAKLSELQYFRIFKILQYKDIDLTQSYSLGMVLTSTRNEFAKQYCKNLLHERHLHSLFIAGRYFSILDIIEFKNDLISYLSSVENRSDSFIQIVSHMKAVSFSSVSRLFNDQEIVDSFGDNEIFQLKNSQLQNIFELENEQKEIRKTKLCLRILSI